MPHQCTDCGRTFDDGSKEMLSGCPNCGGNKFQFRPDEATRREANGADQTSNVARRGSDRAPRKSDGAPVASAAGSDPSDGSTPTVGAGIIDDDILVAEETPLGASDASESDAAPEHADPPEPAVEGTVARTVGKAATTVRDLVGADDPPRGAPADVGAPSAPTPASAEQPGDSGDGPRASDSREDTAQASARGEVVSPGDVPETLDQPATASETDAPANDHEETRDEYEDPADRPDLADLRAELNEQFESIKVLEPGQYELNLMELYNREEYIIALQEDGKYTIQVPEGYGEA